MGTACFERWKFLQKYFWQRNMRWWSVPVLLYFADGSSGTVFWAVHKLILLQNIKNYKEVQIYGYLKVFPTGTTVCDKEKAFNGVMTVFPSAKACLLYEWKRGSECGAGLGGFPISPFRRLCNGYNRNPSSAYCTGIVWCR